jgi:hypothetical protein
MVLKTAWSKALKTDNRMSWTPPARRIKALPWRTHFAGHAA